MTTRQTITLSESQIKVLPPKTRLAGIKPGKLKEPLKALIFGTNGAGKSTLAAHSPAPIWCDAEGGSAQLPVARYPFREGLGGHIPLSYEDVMAMLDDLAASDHAFQTLVLDGLETFEAMVAQFVCKRDGQKNLDGYGYGKGQNAALDQWRAVLAKVERLQAARGMNVLLIGHSIVRTFKSPTTEDFDRYNLSLNDKVAGLLKDWVDIVGFAAFEDGAGKGSGSRVKGFTTGRRMLYLERTAAYDAKSRYPLPAEVELDPENPWAPFAKALSEGESMDAPALAALVSAEAERIGDDAISQKVAAAIKEAVAANDIERLRRNLLALKRVPTKQSEPQAA